MKYLDRMVDGMMETLGTIAGVIVAVTVIYFALRVVA